MASRFKYGLALPALNGSWKEPLRGYVICRIENEPQSNGRDDWMLPDHGHRRFVLAFWTNERDRVFNSFRL